MRLAVLACLLLAGCAAPPAPVPPERARGFVAVADRVEPVAEAFCARRAPSANCDFLVAVDDRPGLPPNAYQTVGKGGRPIIAVTVALLGMVANDDELALILSHEAAHHVAGHLDRQADYASRGAAALGEIAGRSEGATPELVRQARIVGAELGARSFSKEFELEADGLGAVVALEAGFDPLRGAAFFGRIPDPGDRFLGSHPSNAERIAAVRAAVGAAS